MKYKIKFFHEKLVVYHAITSLIVRYTTNISWKIVILYFTLYILYFNNSILSRSTIYVILARQEILPEDDALTSKHVGVNHM